MNERGQYGSRPLRKASRNGGALSVIASLALPFAVILLIGLGGAFLLIRWSGV